MPQNNKAPSGPELWATRHVERNRIAPCQANSVINRCVRRRGEHGKGDEQQSRSERLEQLGDQMRCMHL